MRKLQNICRITRYQLGQLLNNPRLYVILCCNFIFLWSLLSSLRKFLKLYHDSATPFLFPFLFTDSSVLFCFLSGVIVLFSNAPFFNQSQRFLTIRTGKTVWALGQILYMLLGSFLYMVLLFLLSVLFLFPRISLSLEWGSVWNTLARTTLGADNGVEVIVSLNMINQFRPIEALGYTMLMGTLNSFLLGLILFAGNLFFRREVGIAAAMLMILAPYRLALMPTFLHYIVTTAWMNPSYLFYILGYQGPDFKQQLAILCGFIVILTVICIYGIKRKDLPEVEE